MSPTALAHQEIGDRHVLRLPVRAEQNLSHTQLTARNTALEACPRQADLVCPLERLHVLRPRGDTRCRAHYSSCRPVVPPDGLLVVCTPVVARAARGRPSLDRS